MRSAIRDIWPYGLEENRKANIISNPRITTVDNREAKIVVGQKIPLIVQDVAGNPVKLNDSPDGAMGEERKHRTDKGRNQSMARIDAQQCQPANELGQSREH